MPSASDSTSDILNFSSSSPRSPLSVIILTRDEAVNIRNCLGNLAWADELIIVDSGSTDDTLTIAGQVRPDFRVFYHPFRDFGDQRNWALDNTQPKHQWILFIDADEYCTEELAKEIDAFIRSPGDAVGAYIAGKNYFLGKWLKYTMYYPSYQLRLLKLGEVRFRKEGHGQAEVTDGPLVYLKKSWNHYGFSKGIEHWLARHNRYSSEEVDLLLRLRSEPIRPLTLLSTDPLIRKRALKRIGTRLPFRPLAKFLYAYFIKRGFLDGYAGLVFSALRFSFDLNVVAKIAERRYQGKWVSDSKSEAETSISARPHSRSCCNEASARSFSERENSAE